jgi:putative Mg2+ transporter-C (MgtC) family protein
MNDELEVLLRVAAAAFLGGVIGFERKMAGKSAGLRTHMLVALSAALFVGLGELAVSHFPAGGDDSARGELQYDPIRTIQAVVIGIGFLGSGITFVNQERTRTHGLTTAAAVWATAGVGLACGLGLFVTAAGTTLLLLLILRALMRYGED